MMTTTELPSHLESEAYWLGWLAAACVNAQRLLTEAGPGGHPRHDPGKAVELLTDALDHFKDTPLAAALTLDTATDKLYDGWIVEAADGKAQACRDTYDDADAALDDVEAYWYQAETCGHPMAVSYVKKLRPFRVRQITRGERDKLREYPAVIDREP